MTIDDFKIPGTKMPDLTKCTYRVVHWKKTSDSIGEDLGLGRVSYGYVLNNGVHYILVDTEYYEGTDYYMVPVDEVEKLAIEQGMIKETKTLPKSFACMNTNQKLWDKYMKWLNFNYGINIYGDTDCYYGISLKENIEVCNKVKTFDVLLSLEEWDEIVNGKQIKEEIMEKTHTVTRAQLKEIWDVACTAWKDTIVKFANRSAFKDTIELTDNDVNAMFAASNNIQIPVLEGIFGKQTAEIDLSTGKVDGKTLFDNNRNLTKALMCVRARGKFENKAFILNEEYNWELVKEDLHGYICLVPTRK
jgi:hypothetical protein